MLVSPTPANDRTVAVAVPPITPSLYVRLRREAAGLTRMQVAHRLYAMKTKRFFGDKRPRRLFSSVDQALATIEQIEIPGAKVRYRPVIDVLAEVFPLDADVYHQLASEPANRHPAICRDCGCSTHDSCDGICTLEGSTCTHCIAGARKLAA